MSNQVNSATTTAAALIYEETKKGLKSLSQHSDKCACRTCQLKKK